MRIYNREKNEVLSSVEIFLTLDEADELQARVAGLIRHPEDNHTHLDTDERDGKYEKELIIAIYSENNLHDFDDRSKQVILKDK